jgi:hypothetical protein
MFTCIACGQFQVACYLSSDFSAANPLSVSFDSSTSYDAGNRTASCLEKISNPWVNLLISMGDLLFLPHWGCEDHAYSVLRNYTLFSLRNRPFETIIYQTTFHLEMTVYQAASRPVPAQPCQTPSISRARSSAVLPSESFSVLISTFPSCSSLMTPIALASWKTSGGNCSRS